MGTYVEQTEGPVPKELGQTQTVTDLHRIGPLPGPLMKIAHMLKVRKKQQQNNNL